MAWHGIYYASERAPAFVYSCVIWAEFITGYGVVTGLSFTGPRNQSFSVLIGCRREGGREESSLQGGVMVWCGVVWYGMAWGRQTMFVDEMSN